MSTPSRQTPTNILRVSMAARRFFASSLPKTVQISKNSPLEGLFLLPGKTIYRFFRTEHSDILKKPSFSANFPDARLPQRHAQTGALPCSSACCAIFSAAAAANPRRRWSGRVSTPISICRSLTAAENAQAAISPPRTAQNPFPRSKKASGDCQKSAGVTRPCTRASHSPSISLHSYPAGKRSEETKGFSP